MAKKRKKTRKRKTIKVSSWIKKVLILVILSVSVFGIKYYVFDVPAFQATMESRKPEVIEDLLTVNPYSRPQLRLRGVKGIVIHYVANPGSSAKENRDYFESLKDTHITKASSHYVIGLEGEIIQCIPENEIAYASNRRNSDTISIECCHPGENGAFYEGTRQSLVNLTAWLCKKYGLTEEEVIRHYDVTGKLCPLYYVENEQEWQEFRQEIKQKLKNY